MPDLVIVLPKPCTISIDSEAAHGLSVNRVTASRALPMPLVTGESFVG